MSETLIILGSIVLACAMGAAIMGWLARGYIGPWMKAKRTGGILLKEISESGDRAKLTVATPDAKKEAFTYKGMDGQKHVFTPRGVMRLNRVRHAMVTERDTSPLMPTKISDQKDDDGEYKVFQHWDDTREMENLLIRALTKPKVPSKAQAMNLMLYAVAAGVGALVMYFVMSQGM